MKQEQLRQLSTAAKSLQSCPTLCDPIDSSPSDPAVPGILQARTLEWAAISFSNAWKWKVKVKSLSRVQLLATPWTAAYQAPPSRLWKMYWWVHWISKGLGENTLEKFYDKSCMKMLGIFFSFLSSIWFEYLWLESSLWKSTYIFQIKKYILIKK